MMKRFSLNSRGFGVWPGVAAVIVACLVGTPGCGPKTVASTAGTVSGTVTFKGASLTSGVVHLAPAADVPGWSGDIDDKGGYVVPYVTPGTHKVWLSGAMSLPGLPVDTAFKSIPKEYLSAATTPLSVTVKAGQTSDFPIAIGQ